MTNFTSILDWIRYGTSLLRQSSVYYGHGTDNGLDEATALVLGSLHLPYNLDSSYFSARLSEAEKALLAENFRRRVDERIPVAYLTKSCYFGGLEFYVDERVLIPRSPLAEFLEKNPDRFEQILDLCCGSGCLGLLAKYHNPAAAVVMADLSSDALAVAEINRRRFQLEEEVEIVQSNLFAALAGQHFDLILCNPPYVAEEERDYLPPEYQKEPEQALFAGADGLDLVRKILFQASDYLTENGLLLLEVGASWPNLELAFPNCDFDWLEFERGGVGVCAIGADELAAWRLAGLLD